MFFLLLYLIIGYDDMRDMPMVNYIGILLSFWTLVFMPIGQSRYNIGGFEESDEGKKSMIGMVPYVNSSSSVPPLNSSAVP